MNNRQVETILHDNLTGSVPDVWDAIESTAVCPVYIDFNRKDRSYRRYRIAQKAIAITVALLIMSSCLLTIGPNQIAQAISKIFWFIPGVAVTEDIHSDWKGGENIADTGDILYSAYQTDFSRENIKLELKAIASQDTITLYIKGCFKNFPEDSEEQLFDRAHTLNYSLAVNGKNYTSKSIEKDEHAFGLATTSGQGTESTIVTSKILQFHLKPGDIDQSSVYTLTLPVVNIQMKIRLQPVQTAETLNQISASDSHNKITILALSTLFDGKLIVDLYPINRSGYKIEQFYSVKESKYLYIQTDQGPKIPEQTFNYDSIQSYLYFNEPQTRFIFDVSDGAKDFVLKIPCITVNTGEEANLSVPIPEIGETKLIQKTVEYRNSTVNILSAERKLVSFVTVNTTVENKNPNAELESISATYLDKDGATIGTAFSFDDSHFTVPIPEDGAKSAKVQLHYTIYRLMDEYTIKLTPTTGE